MSIIALFLLYSVDSSVAAPPHHPPPPRARHRRWHRHTPPPWVKDSGPLDGTATIYEDTHIATTASGDPYKSRKRRAAHRTLPIGAKVRVTCPATGRSVKVIINDRGPENPQQLLMLTPKAAKRLRVTDLPPQKVDLEVIGCKKKYGNCP